MYKTYLAILIKSLIGHISDFWSVNLFKLMIEKVTLTHVNATKIESWVCLNPRSSSSQKGGKDHRAETSLPPPRQTESNPAEYTKVLQTVIIILSTQPYPTL